MRLVNEPLSPPDAQLLMALRPHVAGQSQQIVDRLLAEYRGGKLTTDRIWSSIGALAALQDLENTFRRKLVGFEQQEPVA